MEGKVYFAGAGSAGIGNLTVKAYWALKHADTVVYDAAVDFSVLLAIPCETAVYEAEKVMALEELLVKEAKEGKTVVRLVSGSPFIFGQSVCETDELAREKVPFEVIPGLTAEVRLLSKRVAVSDQASLSYRTVMLDQEADWVRVKESLAIGKQKGTLFIRTGSFSLKTVVEGLFEAGIHPLQPAAVVEHAGSYDETVTIDTLDGLSCYIKNTEITPPTVLIVGEKGSKLEERCGCDVPVLKGARVIVAKATKKSSQLEELLEQQGAYVLPLPIVEINETGQLTNLQMLVERPFEYEWIAFCSEVGVESFFKQLTRCNIDLRELRHIKFAVIGKRTNQALLDHGCKAELIAISSYGFMFAKELTVKMENEHGKKRVLIVAAKDRECECCSYLLQHGVPCEKLELYETVPVVPKFFPYQKGDIVTFTSSVCVEQFARYVKKEERPYVKAVCINEPVCKKAVSCGMDACMAKVTTAYGMLNQVMESYRKGK